jgi:hypothetical protein
MAIREHGRLTRRALLGGTGGLLATPAIVRAQGQAGVALVIGNSRYAWEASLPNVRRDVAEIARTFEAMGLKTEVVQDAGQSTMQGAIDKLGATARNADMAFFYFAGHGAQWKFDTYLVPVDADLSAPKTDGLVHTRSAIRATGGARLNINIFDNCRNNPADGWRQREAQDVPINRAATNAQKKTGQRYNLWSTMSGRVAVDGPAGQNSPFASALLRQLDADQVDTSTLGAKVRRDLMISTQGRQIPTDFDAYDQPRSFKGARLGRRANDGGVDTSRICELGKAYAFASANGIWLPEGLVAIRPRGTSRYGKMVGSFKFTERFNGAIAPILLVCLSLEENDDPVVMIAGQEGGGGYRLVRSRVSENTLEFAPVAGGNRWIFDWRSADGGSFSILATSGSMGSNASHSSSFTRLDG